MNIIPLITRLFLSLALISAVSGCREPQPPGKGTKEFNALFGVFNDGLRENKVKFASRVGMSNPVLVFPAKANLHVEDSLAAEKFKNKSYLNGADEVSMTMYLDSSNNVQYWEKDAVESNGIFILRYRSSNGRTSFVPSDIRKRLQTTAEHYRQRDEWALLEYGIHDPKTENITFINFIPFDATLRTIDGAPVAFKCSQSKVIIDNLPPLKELRSPRSCRLSFTHPLGVDVQISFPLGLIPKWRTMLNQVTDLTNQLGPRS